VLVIFNQGWIEDVRARNPLAILRTVAFPVDEVLESATSPTGVHDNRFYLGDMERWVYAETRREMKAYGGRIDDLGNFVRTYESRGQLTGHSLEGDVPSGKPYLLANGVLWGRTSPGVSKSLGGHED